MAALPGGVSAAETAAASDQVVLAAPVLPGPAAGTGSEGDAERRQAREDAGVTAILHESVPVRYWDHDLGPAELRLFALALGAPSAGTPVRGGAGSPGDDAAAPRDLTPAPGRALDQQAFTVAPDGGTVVTSWRRWDSPAEIRSDLVAIDTTGGDPRTLLSARGFDFESPEVAPTAPSSPASGPPITPPKPRATSPSSSPS